MGGAMSSAGAPASKKKQPASISSVDRAMLDLKNSRDKLSRYKRKLEADEEKLVIRAKQAKSAGQTKTALNLLKLRKLKQREVETAEGQLLTVLQLVQTIDSKQNEQQILQAMKQGKDALRVMHEEMTVDDVLELMDQIQEEAQVEHEISGIIQGTAASLTMEDEADVEAELAALMNGEDVALPTAPTSQPLPVAPSNKLPDTATSTAAEVPEKKVAVAL